MNGDGPGQFERELYECADLVLGDFSGRRVDPVLDVFPNCRLHGDLPVIAGAFHEYRPVADPGDSADLAVEIELFGRRIVFDEHHLGALFECERQARSDTNTPENPPRLRHKRNGVSPANP